MMDKKLFRRFGALTCRYSGDRSQPFWNRVNAIRAHDWDKWQKLYAMGAELQQMESDMLKALQGALTRTYPKGPDNTP